MSRAYQVSPSWRGFDQIRRLVIFGDSYTTIEDAYVHQKPTSKHPLSGVPFPGRPWTEPGQPNWVGYLISKYCPYPRYIPESGDGQRDEEIKRQNADWLKDPLLVYDYAHGGDTVPGVKRQIETMFLAPGGLSSKPEWAPWTADETLFVTWIGINDTYQFPAATEPLFDMYFDLQQKLYDTGARNFLFIDVPRIDQIPPVPVQNAEAIRKKVEEWNTTLCQRTRQFCATHHDASVFIYSSFQSFTWYLENLELLGIPRADEHLMGGQVWFDVIHPATKLHDHIAHTLADFLNCIMPMYR